MCFENPTVLIKILLFAGKLILEARIQRWRDQYPDAPGGRASEEPRGAGPNICIDNDLYHNFN